MKNQLIIALVQAGFLSVTNNTIENEAYKVVKLRSVLKGAFGKVQELEEALLKDCGIEDADAFNAELKALAEIKKPSKEDEKKIADMRSKSEKFNRMESDMLNDEQELAFAPMSYDTWHSMVLESHIKVSAELEDAVMGVLWVESE